MTDWRSLVVALLFAGGMLFPASSVLADEADEGSGLTLHRELDRASDFAPAGVLLDHTHKKGDWTFLFRYTRVERKDLLDGDRPVTADEVLQSYQKAPLSFDQNVFTTGAMYAPRDRFTFALLLPVIQNRLREWNGTSIEESESSGIGDAKLIFLIPFIQKGDVELTQFNFGISFPTGSIQQTSPGTDQRLPYIMQLGSGSWDAIWGITYTGAHNKVSWGGQFEGKYRIADNSIGYRLGTVYHASAWVAGGFGRWLSASGRFAWTRNGNIRGEDPTLMKEQLISPLNDNKKQAGTTVEVGPGLNILLPVLGGQRLSVEALFPIYQDLDGPQLASDFTLTAGWQWIF